MIVWMTPRNRQEGGPRIAVMVDVVLFRRGGDGDLEILLIRRGRPPFSGQWALPGGFVDEGESLEEAARRELEEETGLRVPTIVQLKAYGDPARDPRGHSVSVAFFGEVAPSLLPAAGDDAEDAAWYSARSLPELAFDHDQIIRDAIAHLNGTA